MQPSTSLGNTGPVVCNRAPVWANKGLRSMRPSTRLGPHWSPWYVIMHLLWPSQVRSMEPWALTGFIASNHAPACTNTGPLTCTGAPAWALTGLVACKHASAWANISPVAYNHARTYANTGPSMQPCTRLDYQSVACHSTKWSRGENSCGWNKLEFIFTFYMEALWSLYSILSQK